MSRVAEFFAMGGYAFFVWGAYGVTAVVMAAEVALLARRRRTLWQRLGRMNRINNLQAHKDETQA